MIQRSPLAQHVQHIYDTIASHATRSAVVHVRINNWVTVVWCAASNQTGQSPQTLRPYHTLLLAPDALHTTLPRDCSPALYRLVTHANPLKSFSELAEELDMPLAHVYRLAAHLVYWQRATIIHKLSKTSIFMVSPNAALDVYVPSPTSMLHVPAIL